MTATETLEISEIFASIQGESSLAGWPCTFVRLTGCPLRCTYCDTSHAFSGGVHLPLPEVLERVRACGLPLVEVTGGEPLAQAGARPLIRALLDDGRQVLVETGGGVSIAGVDPRARVILDVKTPDSGACDLQDWDNLALLRPQDEIKIVICSRTDYEWARELLSEQRWHESRIVHFSPVVSPAGDLRRALAEWIVADCLPVRLNLQLHVWIWGPGARGV